MLRAADIYNNESVYGKSTIAVLEEIFSRKVVLYNNLVDCFMRERESLINIDLDALWSISKEKEEICAGIASLTQQFMAQIGPEMKEAHLKFSDIIGSIPRNDRGKFQEIRRTLMALEMEIEALKKENMMYIDDSLRFLDEMVSLIAGEGKEKIMYDDKCHLHETGMNILLSREA